MITGELPCSVSIYSVQYKYCYKTQCIEDEVLLRMSRINHEKKNEITARKLRAVKIVDGGNDEMTEIIKRNDIR